MGRGFPARNRPWIPSVNTGNRLSQLPFSEDHLHCRAVAVGAGAGIFRRVHHRLDGDALQAGHLKWLFVLAEEVIVGGVRNERWLTHIGGGGAAGRWGGSPGGVQTLDEADLDHEFTASWPRFRPNDLQ